MKHLLIADPDPEVQARLNKILPHAVWVTESAKDNTEVLDRVRRREYDLVITGAGTSGADDVELLREIRLVRPHTKMIILAGESTPEEVLAAMREHAFSYFSKPFSPVILAEMVEMAVAHPCWDDGIELVSASPDWIGLRVRCQDCAAERLIQFVRELKTELSPDERENVAAAFREILMNAIEHGGGLDPEKYVEISYVRTKHMVLCRIKDPGPGFRSEELPHAAVSNPPDEPFRHAEYREEHGLRPGGFGLMLARKLVDDLVYNEQGNEVLLIKYLDARPEEAA